MIITYNVSAKFEIKHRIRNELLPSIRRYEREYWELLPIENIVISDDEATEAVVILENAVAATESEYISRKDLPSEIMPLLQEIKADLSSIDKTASAKLKLTLPLIPMIASYELEADTENLMYDAWKFIKRMVGR